MALTHGAQEPLGVRNGLVLYLDAANARSYPRTGTTWFDRSGNSNHMTLTGNPSYLPNSGVLSFNGSTQYGSLTGLNYSASTFTIIAASRYFGGTNSRIISSISNNWLLGHWNGFTDKYFAEGWVFEGTSPADTNWRIYAATENHSTDQRSFYINNVAKVTNSTAGSAGFNGLSVGRSGLSGGSEYSSCEVSFIQVYNRILTTDELTQNYNVFKGRFGLS